MAHLNMKRHIHFVAVTIVASACAGAVATAKPESPIAVADALTPRTNLLGRYLVDGVDARGQAYNGVLDLQSAGAGLRYVRRVPQADGRVVDEHGEARLVDGKLMLRERDPAAGLTATFQEVSEASPRRAVYQPTELGPHVMAGRFTGSTRGSGTERLRRADADNTLDLLVDGPQAFPSIYAAIRSAKHSIYLQTFSWFDDRAGREMADLLIAKKNEGVDVRLLVEAFPQKGGVGWKTGKYLRENGVDLRLHHTLTSGLLNSVKNVGRKVKNFFGRLFGRPAPAPVEKRGILTHDHRKVIVVDGRVAFTGGMNIGDKYLEGTTWHDLHCRFEGSAAKAMVPLFFDRWRASGGAGEPRLSPAASQPGPGTYPIEIADNVPGLRLDVTKRYMESIEQSRQQILIENAYMLYDPVVNALKRKAQAGVSVTVIVPSNDLNDEAFARDAFLWIQNDVVRSGVNLYKYRDRMAHGKVAVFDQRLATIGTTNLDMMAMERNAEINIFVPDRRFCRTLTTRVFEADVPNSDKVKVEKLTFMKKVLGGTMHMMRSFL